MSLRGRTAEASTPTLQPPALPCLAALSAAAPKPLAPRRAASVGDIAFEDDGRTPPAEKDSVRIRIFVPHKALWWASWFFTKNGRLPTSDEMVRATGITKDQYIWAREKMIHWRHGE